MAPEWLTLELLIIHGHGLTESLNGFDVVHDSTVVDWVLAQQWRYFVHNRRHNAEQ